MRFTVEGTTYLFTYDPDTRAMSLSVDGGTDYRYDDLCVFDEEGRITAMNFEGRTVMSLAYDGGELIMSSFGEESGSPVKVPVDWEAGKAQMPPFDDPEDFMLFTQWGDLTGGEGNILNEYTYDEKGNVLSVSLPYAEEFSYDFTYGDAPMTHAWQRVPVKFILTWTLGRPMAVFAMDMMCLGLYQLHGEK